MIHRHSGAADAQIPQEYAALRPCVTGGSQCAPHPPFQLEKLATIYLMLGNKHPEVGDGEVSFWVRQEWMMSRWFRRPALAGFAALALASGAMAQQAAPTSSSKPVAIKSKPKVAPKSAATGAKANKPALGAAQAAIVAKPHRLIIQVDQNDPAVMNLALNNATNVIEYYRAKGQDVNVDLVTYGPGLHMLRDDTSPVKDRIKQLKDYAFPSTVQFSACGNTKENMEKQEGKPVSIVSNATLVPSGVVHLMELQEKGWSYVRP
jgi:uncharacterized protein